MRWVMFCMLIFTCITNAIALDFDGMKRNVTEVYSKYKNNKDGKNAGYIPILAKVNPALFGIAVVTIDGQVITVGDANTLFAIESVSKPFVYALALHDNGEKFLNSKVGLNATGRKFNSVMALEESDNHIENPLVNAGAIQVTSYINGKDSTDKWQRVLSFMSQLANEKLTLGEEYYRSESATNQHNMAIAYLLDSYQLMRSDPKDALDRYTKACSVVLTAKQLARMGSVLANDGMSPFTKQKLLSESQVRTVLSQMAVNGMYENSGTWWTEVGIPAKSGVSGAILAVVPNKMAIVVFSPRLDEAGNSVRAQLVIKELAERWKLHALD